MGELESLLLVLALIYLSECLVWVPRGAVAFASWRGRRFGLRPSGTGMSNQRGGLLLSNPLPPLGTVFIVPNLPVSLAPAAVFAYSSECLDPGGRPWQTARHLPIKEIRKVAADGRKLRVNGELFLKAASTFSARWLAELLRRLRKTPEHERAEFIKQMLDESLDTAKLAVRWRDFQSRARLIRILSNGLFVYLFLVVAPLILRFGFGQFGLWLLVGMLAQTITIAVLFRRAHMALYPDAGEERLKPFLTMLLAPPAAIRAADLLARHLLETFHPLAVAQVLCSSVRFKSFARQALLDLRYPLLPVCPTTEPEPVATEQWFRTARREAAEKFVQLAGLKPDDLTAMPGPTEPANQSCCPRCGAQFVTRSGTCSDCGGRPLEPFKGRNSAFDASKARLSRRDM
jgi:hypothetical protein